MSAITVTRIGTKIYIFKQFLLAFAPSFFEHLPCVKSRFVDVLARLETVDAVAGEEER